MQKKHILRTRPISLENSYIRRYMKISSLLLILAVLAEVIGILRLLFYQQPLPFCANPELNFWICILAFFISIVLLAFFSLYAQVFSDMYEIDLGNYYGQDKKKYVKTLLEGIALQALLLLFIIIGVLLIIRSEDIRAFLL